MKLAFLDAKRMRQIPNIHVLDSFGEVTYYQTTFPSQTLERIKGVNIVITNKVELNITIIEQADKLKLICVAATGTNNIDQATAKERGIPVKNVSDYASKSVVQITFLYYCTFFITPLIIIDMLSKADIQKMIYLHILVELFGN